VAGKSATSGSSFTVIQPPTITNFTPSSGAAGTSVTITGANFSSTPANDAVTFGGLTATVSSATATQLVVTVPTGVATGKIGISVNGGAIVYSTNNFAVPATVTGFSPSSLLPGTSVTITGTGFSSTAANDCVSFNGSGCASVTSATSSQLVAVANGISAGAICVSVNGGAQGCSSSNFVVPAPTVTGFTPASGSTGTSVTITGTNFNPTSGYSAVDFSGHPTSNATVTSASATQIIVTVPYGAATGPLTIGNGGSQNTTTSNSFTVPLPTITSFTPASGQLGSSVTIIGTGFSTTPANNVVNFRISSQTRCGEPATVVSATSTQLVVAVPDGAVTGPIYVSTDGGYNGATSANSFNVLAPTVSSFTPSNGQVGTHITVSGAGFDSSCLQNDLASISGQYINTVSATPTQVVLYVTNNATTGPVCINIPGGPQGCSNSDFTVLPVLITNISPTSGAGGNPVTITGAGFSPTPANNAVKFNGTSAPVSSATPTQLVALVPYGATTGPIGVSVNGTAQVTTGTFTPQQPMISGFTPTSGLLNTSVTISGTGFDPIVANNLVKFNAATAVVSSASATQLVATVPYGATTGPIGVHVNGGSGFAYSTTNFSVPAPIITSFSPASGLPGTAITITGTGFDATPGNDAVMFYDGSAVELAATITSASTTQLVVNVPWGARTGLIGVSVNGGTLGTSSTNFTVPLPTISGFTPQSGPKDTTVTITGTNFDASAASNNAVYFRDNNTYLLAANVTSASATQLTVTVPYGAVTSYITVSVDGSPLVSSTGLFTVPVPTITAFTPTSGRRGTTVTITGTNFDALAVNNAVTFGAAASVTSASPTQLVTTVPYGAVTGQIGVSVNGGTIVYSSTSFTVPVPTISGFSPASGPIGTSITITGTNFDPVALYDQVLINGGSLPATSASTTQLVAMVPPCATSGAIHVTVDGGPGVSSVSNFTVAGPPTITDFAPTSGPGGTRVTINGTNFSPWSQYDRLTMNGVSVPVGTATSTQLVATIPAGVSTGPFQLSIGGCSSTTSSGSFSIAPGIVGFTPTSGQAGTSVTIYGSHFDPTAANDTIKFNGITATVTSATATQLVTTAPPGVTTGPISVTVGGATANSPGVFAVLPTITDFTPNLGPTGTTVTITGSNFAASPTNNVVSFNGTSATVTSGSATQLVVIVPAGASTGPISIGIGDQIAMSRSDFTVSGGTTPPTSYQYDAAGRLLQVAPPANSPSQYTYDALGNLTSITGTPAGSLSIFSVAPGQGATGDSVTINGQGFDANAANDQVKFNGTAATVLAASANQLIVAVPSGATTGTVSVTVAGTTANSPAPFAVTN